MNCSIKLIHNKGFTWYSDKDTYVKGYCYTTAGEYLEGNSLLKYISEKLDHAGPNKEFIKALNGVFSFIHSNQEEVIIFSDKSRFFPVFYSFIEDSLSITDEPTTLIHKFSKMDLIASEEFRRTGFVTGQDTLIEEIKQVSAGDLVNIKEGKVCRHNIFSYRVKPSELRFYDDPSQTMYQAIQAAAKRFMRSIENCTPVLPLSGGFDSRLLACLLKEHGFDNTICFTYGRPSHEVELSREVAKRLGFKWYFIDYTKILTGKNILESKDFGSYYSYASRLTSMFYLQEYPAVEYLKQNSLIPENSVFLPGHSGDLLGGSQFVKVFTPEIKFSSVAERILKTKYFFYPLNKHEKTLFKTRIQDAINSDDGSLGYSAFEDWDIKEKIAKFIFNSSQVFTHFGYQARFFYWDNELVEFFRCLPPELKAYKREYDQCLKNYYFKKHNVNLGKELSVNSFQIKLQNIKEQIKIILPNRVKRYLVNKNDWGCYRYMTFQMLQELPVKIKQRLPLRSYNSVLINWYLHKIDQLIKQIND